jgi:hypothetical protein
VDSAAQEQTEERNIYSQADRNVAAIADLLLKFRNDTSVKAPVPEAVKRARTFMVGRKMVDNFAGIFASKMGEDAVRLLVALNKYIGTNKPIPARLRDSLDGFMKKYGVIDHE